MKDICSIAACGNPRKARGWCYAHYRRWHRYGDPLGGRPQYDTFQEFLDARTEWQEGCLVWTSMTRSGYAITTWKGSSFSVHRYVWESVNGPIPGGLVIDHKCHNRACCNVAHLRLATYKQNNENHSGEAKNNTSGYRGVVWHKGKNRWGIRLGNSKNRVYGGYFPPYELHVAAYRIRLLRNEYHTFNDTDRD